MASLGEDVPIAATVAVPFACGMLAGGGGWQDALATVVPLAVVVLAAITVAAEPTRPRGGRTIGAALAAGVACGALAAAIAALPPAADHVVRFVGRESAAIEGVVVASERGGARLALVLRAEHLRSLRRQGRVSGLVGVTIAHAPHAWSPGDRVRVVGRLRRPRNFGNPDEYDFAGALARRGIRVRMFLWDETAITRRHAGGGGVERWRTRLEAYVAGRTAEPVRGYLTAVLLGATQSVDAPTRAALARTGLAHVISVSGFHVAVLAGACFLLLRSLARPLHPARARRRRRQARRRDQSRPGRRVRRDRRGQHSRRAYLRHVRRRPRSRAL